ncbi:Palmitoyltransferase [Caenorhabditis elegans]|uniref:Palmitoyltransferase n=2 Tax=Caenorhabditis elegans TaxID=6239 RepID=Q9U3P7_CAEEL|nr:Palmitoyltransferase [Caenorhabditis elegans]CAB03897.1 Palmitoyltransferase [Caenorhabditis elegans]|eukprot:NP_492960.1 Palmitoyltransferase [Caenorhabditis elegans]
MFKWDPCGLVCVCMIYLLIAYADYVILIWLLLPTFGHSIWTVFHGAVFNCLLATTIVAHTRAMLSDPGTVPISSSKGQNTPNPVFSSDEEDESDEEAVFRHDHLNRSSATEWTMCTRCDSLRPPRAHHCRVCKRCVRKMDHHCPWVNNCVGEYNQKWFLQFIFYVGASSAYSLLVLCLCWVWHDAYGMTGIKGPLGENLYHAKVIHSIMLAMESALFGLFVLAVSCDQLGAIFTDETAIESVQRRGRNYLASSRRPRNSKVAMMKQVCGPGPKLLWLIPCANPQKSTPRYLRTHNQLAHFDV